MVSIKPFYLFISEEWKQRSVRASNLPRPLINALMSLLTFTDLDLKLCWELSIPRACGKHLMPAISQSPRMFTEPIRDVLYHKLSPLGEKKRASYPSHDNGAGCFCSCQERSPSYPVFSLSECHCAAILNILHALIRPLEKTNTCSFQLDEEHKQSDPRRYFHLPFCPWYLEEIFFKNNKNSVDKGRRRLNLPKGNCPLRSF